MKVIKEIDLVMSKFTGIFGFISGIGIIFVILLMTVDVLLRKITGGNISGSYEMVERTLFCFVFAGLSYTETAREHICVTMIISHLQRIVRFIIFGIMQLLGSAMIFYLAYASYLQTGISHQTGTSTSVLLIPLYPFYAFECVCCVVFGITILWAAIKTFAAIGNKELANDIQSSWS